MMRLFRKKDGFTLIELLIVILTGTIVTAAATTILLLAMRINRKTLDTVERQSIMRIMQSVFEDMGSDGDYEFTTNAIKIKDTEDDYVIRYDADEDKIVTGQGGVLMENVSHFDLSATEVPFDYVNGLYTFSVKAQEEIYVSSVYGRTQDNAWFADDPSVKNETGRNLLVGIAASQLGSTGEIVGVTNTSFAQWFSNNYANWSPAQIASVEEKAWCSSFVSWVLYETNHRERPDKDADYIEYLKLYPQKANVNYLWLETYAQSGSERLHIYGDGYVPQPGDLIFFTDVKEQVEEEGLIPLKNLDAVLVILDGEEPVSIIRTEIWREDQGLMIHKDHKIGVPTSEKCFLPTTDVEKYSILKHLLGVKGDGLDHVGIVAKVETEIVNDKEVSYVYTIEGNVNGKVIMRKFPLTNTAYSDDVLNTTEKNKLFHIFGYATLNWNPAYK